MCAAAFLFVGFVHSLHHFDAMAPIASYQADFSSSDDTSRSSDKASVAIHHCHGCVMPAMTVASPAGALIPTALERLAIPCDGLRPHPPVAETPPPKFSI
jgi:hypothetical protein